MSSRRLPNHWRGERHCFAGKPVEALPSMRWSSLQRSPAEPLLRRMSTTLRLLPCTRTALTWRGYNPGSRTDKFSLRDFFAFREEVCRKRLKKKEDAER